MFNFIAVIKARTLKTLKKFERRKNNIGNLLELVRRDRERKIFKVELLRLCYLTLKKFERTKKKQQYWKFART